MKLVILDYSGTLSMGSVLFASPSRLSAELERCRLKGLGVSTCETFWEIVVNPTWHEGSTTRAGYKEVMKKALHEAFDLDPSVVSPAAERFVDAYMAASIIDPSWKPVLEKLKAHPGVETVVASDHYAEATDAILSSFSEMNIEASALREPVLNIRDASFIIANSADIGFHKDDPRFWEAVKVRVLPEKASEVLIVDDFGANEQAGNSYALREKIKARIRQTEDALEEVFQVRVDVFPFILKDGCPEDDTLYRNLVGEASKRIEQFLNLSLIHI
jgi:hypothetical protein